MSEGTKFNWGISGSEGESDESILLNNALICYSGRQGGLVAGENYTVGGQQDYKDLQAGGYGVFRNFPMRTPYLAREMVNATAATCKYAIRIEYDIVTLTTAEQADLYQRELCG